VTETPVTIHLPVDLAFVLDLLILLYVALLLDLQLFGDCCINCFGTDWCFEGV
jgi:hypothetical protein